MVLVFPLVACFVDEGGDEESAEPSTASSSAAPWASTSSSSAATSTASSSAEPSTSSSSAEPSTSSSSAEPSTSSSSAEPSTAGTSADSSTASPTFPCFPEKVGDLCDPVGGCPGPLECLLTGQGPDTGGVCVPFTGDGGTEGDPCESQEGEAQCRTGFHCLSVALWPAGACGSGACCSPYCFMDADCPPSTACSLTWTTPHACFTWGTSWLGWCVQ